MEDKKNIHIAHICYHGYSVMDDLTTQDLGL